MKRTLISAACLLLCGAALAQNLDPTVEVTNAYVREASGIEKPSQLLEVPDSVLRFNLDFVYAVNETPYQGAYEFTPYLVQTRPQSRPSQEGTLYLSAGAGYSLHPELAVVYTPVKTQKLHVNLFADHHSFIGDYHTIALDSQNCFTPDGTTWKGKNMRSSVGADALLNWGKTQAALELRYQHILATHQTKGDLSNNKFQLKGRLSTPASARVSLNLSTRLSYLGVNEAREFHNVTDAVLGYRMEDGRLALNLGFQALANSGNFLTAFSAAPHYQYGRGRLNVDLGVKLSFLSRSANDFYPSPSGIIFPDVRLSYAAVPDKLVFTASATGGDKLWVYTEIIDSNPYLPFAPVYMDNTAERVNLALGARGQLSSRFHYSVQGGFAYKTHALLPGYRGNTSYFGFVDALTQFFAQAACGWKSDVLDVDAGLAWRNTRVSAANAEDTLFLPAALSGNASVFYKWGTRLKAGVLMNAQSKRLAPASTLPGFVDLGLSADFGITRSLGVWMRAGNLLNQVVQTNAFYAEKGVYFTAGISWNL